MLKAVAARGGTFGVVKSNSFLYEKTANIVLAVFSYLYMGDDALVSFSDVR